MPPSGGPGSIQARPLTQGILAIAIWSGAFIATKIALGTASVATVTWLRFAIGTLTLWALARRAPSGATVSTKTAVILGFVGVFLHQSIQMQGLTTASASAAAFLVASAPLFMAALGRFVLGEAPGRWFLAGSALAVAGVFLLVTRGQGELPTLHSFAGEWLTLLSGLTWAIFSVLSRRALGSTSNLPLLLRIMTAGLVFLTIRFVAAAGWRELGQISATSWIAIVYLGIGSSAAAYVLWFGALRSLTSSQSGGLLYLEPLFTVVVAWLLLGERLTALGLLGGIGVLAGVAVASLRGRAPAIAPARLPDA